MNITLSDLLPYIVTALSGVVGWLIKELASIRRAHSEHRTHVAEKYVTKDDLREDFQRVYATLDRIEKKLDHR